VDKAAEQDRRMTEASATSAAVAPPLTGIHHIELTVRELERSLRWYADTLGLSVARRLEREGRRIVMLRRADSPAAPVLALVEHPDGADDSFDERRTGLDHLAFAVADAAAVDAWAEHLDRVGVERSEVKDGALPGSRLVVFRDPDGVQLECYTSQ
jgi:glyoxylase I family protein